MQECDFCSNEIDFHEIVECIASALDAKDPYTAGHSRRVSDMALVVCRLMGLKEHDTEKIHIAGHLHDIGKIGVPDAVLNKEGKLSDIVLMHHERYDGKGYPTGAKGVEIPVGARILAICDSIDAMTSNRCYRKALSFEICFGEIEKNLKKLLTRSRRRSNITVLLNNAVMLLFHLYS